MKNNPDAHLPPELKRWIPLLKPDLPVLCALFAVWCFLVFGFIHQDKFFSDDFGYYPSRSPGEAYGTLDFPTLYHFVKSTLNSVCEHPYRAESMPEMLEPWLGVQKFTMPYLSPPTAVLTMGPFTILPPGIAWSLWTLLSILTGAYTVSLLKHFTRGHFLSTWFVVAFYLSTNVFALLFHGQTTLMTNAALLTIFFISLYPESFKANMATAIILTLLTGKPQVALVAVLFLISGRKWRALFLGGLFTLLCCLFLTPWFSLSWPLDYLQTMSTYGSNAANPAIANQTGIEVMTNFRAFMVGSGILQDAFACQVSWLLFGLSSSLLILFSLKNKPFPSEILFIFSSLIYLLFSPHLNGYEDILLLPVCAMLIWYFRPGKIESCLLLLLAFTISNTSMWLRSVLEISQSFNHVFLLKLMLSCYVFCCMSRHRNGKHSLKFPPG
jgi:hypothetical protein